MTEGGNGDRNTWYYQTTVGRSNLAGGPHTTEEMKALFVEGALSRDTLVRPGLGTAWYVAGKVVVFRKVLTPEKGGTGKYLLLLAVILAFGLIALTRFQMSGDNAPFRGPRVPDIALPPSSSAALTGPGIIVSTNKARAEIAGLPPLTENEQLNTIALARLRDMFEKQYFAHDSPTGEGVTEVAQRVGYHYKIIAENIAYGGFKGDQKIVDGWLQSPGHRKNILSDDVSDIGVAVAKGKFKGEETWIGVQVFGLPSPPVDGATSGAMGGRGCIEPSVNLRNAIEAGKVEVSQLSDSLNGLQEALRRLKEQIDDSRRNRSGDQSQVKEYNSRLETFNQLLQQMNGKKVMLQKMIDAYNSDVRNYNECKQTAKR
jgi:hypothetical protein